MKNSKFEYFLNAIHYCIYLEEVWSNRRLENGINDLLCLASRLFFTRRLKNKIYRRQLRTRIKLNEYMYGKEFGQSIGMAHHLFGYFYSGYPSFLSFILLVFYFRFFGTAKPLLVILVIAIPIGICYIPAYKAVFTNDKYLKYFKQFEKKDNQWHRKWKRITFTFCIGSIITTILGICAAFSIVIT